MIRTRDFIPSGDPIGSGDGRQRPCQWSDEEILDGLSRKFPSCPHKHGQQILKLVARRFWQGVKLGQVVERIAENYVRHDLTDYDRLMKVHGLAREEARIALDEEVDGILREWKQRKGSRGAGG